MRVKLLAEAYLLITIVGTGFVGSAPALPIRGSITNHSIHPSGVRRIIKKLGWKIMGLAQSRVARPRHAFEGYGENPIQIYVTAFKPIREIVVDTPSYSLLEDGETLVIRQQRISVRSILRYDAGGKAFCYSVQGVGVSHNKETGHGGYGGEYGFLYYDNDGDGKFENYEMGGNILPFTPKLPAWVLH